MGTMIIYIGIAAILVGVVVNLLGNNPIPLLPGGVIPQDDGFTVFFPIVVTMIISVSLTVFFRLLK